MKVGRAPIGDVRWYEVENPRLRRDKDDLRDAGAVGGEKVEVRIADRQRAGWLNGEVGERRTEARWVRLGRSVVAGEDQIEGERVAAKDGVSTSP